MLKQVELSANHCPMIPTSIFYTNMVLKRVMKQTGSESKQHVMEGQNKINSNFLLEEEH